MSCSIAIKVNPSVQNYLYEQKLDAHQATKLLQSEARYDLFKATLITVRTNSVQNFCKDFFLPTFINQTLKSHDVVLKVLLTLPTLVLDIVTFPLRAITLIPRFVYNLGKTREHHPLHQYLIQKGIKPKDLAVDSITLRYAKQDKAGNLHVSEAPFDFIALPKGPIARQYSAFVQPCPEQLQFYGLMSN
jgi:hypothetical protein